MIMPVPTFVTAAATMPMVLAKKIARKETRKKRFLSILNENIIRHELS